MMVSAMPAHQTDIVGDEDHRHTELAAQFAKQRHDLGLHGDVECGGGVFVGDQQARIAGDDHGDHDA